MFIDNTYNLSVLSRTTNSLKFPISPGVIYSLAKFRLSTRYFQEMQPEHYNYYYL